MASVLLPFCFGLAASCATLLGGWLTLRFQHRITLVLGLAAGVVLGVALFDLIPEALEIAAARGERAPPAIMGYVALGLALYLLLDRLLEPRNAGAAPFRVHLGPASLTLHSLLDGIGIGVAFQVSPEMGWLIAAAVLTHDVADGVNTVSLSLASARPGLANRWLIINGAAPLLGVAIGSIVRVPDAILGPLFAGFGGVFLYIGACELIPRSHARDPRLRVTIASITGMLLMLVVTRIAH